jgi:hypothetical protein
MKCEDSREVIYEEDDEPSLWKRFNLAWHILFCASCAARYETWEQTRFLLQTKFFPPSPDFSNIIMNRIYNEEADTEEENEQALEIGGFSTKGWVIAGIVMLFSFATAFLGKDFSNMARNEGFHFLLPMGLLIGIGITGSGALFIGSHLKELSDRFKL